MIWKSLDIMFPSVPWPLCPLPLRSPWTQLSPRGGRVLSSSVKCQRYAAVNGVRGAAELETGSSQVLQGNWKSVKDFWKGTGKKLKEQIPRIVEWEKMANLDFTWKYLTKSRKRTKPGKRRKINNNKRHRQKHLDFNIGGIQSALRMNLPWMIQCALKIFCSLCYNFWPRLLL